MPIDHGAILAQLWTAWTGSLAAGLKRVPVADDRGATGYVAHCTDGTLEAIVKIPSNEADPAWATREAFVLESIMPHLAVHAPALLAQVPTEYGPALLLSVCGRMDGDIGDEPNLALAARVLAAIAPLHATSPQATWQSQLPRWGTGTAGAARPHARRVRRFERRYMACVEAWALPEDRTWLQALAEHIVETLERDCAMLLELDERLAHGDLHADNLRFDDDCVYVLDWQSMSIGAPLIDTVYWLSAHMSPATAATCDAIGRDHLDVVDAWPGEAYWDAAQRVSLSGIISGYATRLPAMVGHGEATFVRRQLSAGGHAGVLLARMRG